MLEREQLSLANELRNVLLTGADQIAESCLIGEKFDGTTKRRVSGAIFRIRQGYERFEHSSWLQPRTTRVNTPVVSAVVGRWLYPFVRMADDRDLDFNAAWLRKMRVRLGWSTTDTANLAREKARSHGDTIKLSQQLISKFENGRLKSNPRWLAYVQRAMSEHISLKSLPEGELWDLRLPAELTEYFRSTNEPNVDRRAVHAEGDDLRDFQLLQGLSTRHRLAVRRLIEALVEIESEPATAKARRKAQIKVLPGGKGRVRSLAAAKGE